MTEQENCVITFSQSFQLDQQTIIERLTRESSWEARYRNIMLLGKELPTFDTQLKTDDALVQGCESNVWLHCLWLDNKLMLAASSDAKIVKGLITIVLALYKGKTINELTTIDVEAYFAQLQLTQFLSPSRTNGLFAIVEQIKNAQKNA